MRKTFYKEYVGLFILGFLSSFGLFVVTPTLPLYIKQFGVSYKEIGYFFSAYSLVWVVLQIYAGHLADRYGRKNSIIIGLLIYGTFAFMCFRAQTFTQLLIFRMLQGVGLGLFGPASLGLVGSFEKKGRSFAIFRTAEAIGIVFAPILGGFVGDIALSYPFLISMVAVLLVIASLVLIKEERIKTKRESFFKSVKSMLKLKNFMYICNGTRLFSTFPEQNVLDNGLLDGLTWHRSWSRICSVERIGCGHRTRRQKESIFGIL